MSLWDKSIDRDGMRPTDRQYLSTFYVLPAQPNPAGHPWKAIHRASKAAAALVAPLEVGYTSIRAEMGIASDMAPFRLICCLGVLLVTGCYQSEALLLDQKVSVRLLAEGAQQYSGAEFEAGNQFRRPDSVMITFQGGWYKFVPLLSGTDGGRLLPDPEQKPSFVLFNRVDGSPNDYAWAYRESGMKGFLYGIAQAGRDGRLHLVMASAEDDLMAERAIASGAKCRTRFDQEKRLFSTCTFDTRRSLLNALGSIAE